MRARLGVTVAAVAAVVGTTLAGSAVGTSVRGEDAVTPAASTVTTAAVPPPLQWKPCFRTDYPTMTCAALALPMNYANPAGKKVTIALSRVRHTAKTSKGVLLVNPGGPGGSGLTMNGDLAQVLGKTGQAYDLIGFDPRGVGSSRPALVCNTTWQKPPRPASIPAGQADEDRGVAAARTFAQDCGKKYGSDLKYFDTHNTARDMDKIRVALGAPQVSYFGVSYGTYLGAVYAKLFPTRVKRMVLDSSVDPTAVWYQAGLAQTPAFEKRHRAFIDWVAKNDKTYQLGTDPEKIADAFYTFREKLRTKRTSGGQVGFSEFEDTFVQGGYTKELWPYLGIVLSDIVNLRSTQSLARLWKAIAKVETVDDYNLISANLAVTCRDAQGPRNWQTYHDDAVRLQPDNPFIAWNNTWFGAPCAFWPVAGQTPPNVSNTKVPQVLMVQATDDAATPYAGAMNLHAALTGSRFVVEVGGGNHGVAFAGNPCMDRYVLDYLNTGKRPAAKGPVDARCATTPDPEPLKSAAAAASMEKVAAAAQ